MTPTQAFNVLNWVDAMLSGRYAFGAGRLYDPVTNTYDCLAVACETMGVPRDEDGRYFERKKMFCIVPNDWFQDNFGLPYPSERYLAVNDYSKDYLGVAALLLSAVPDTFKRKKELNRKIEALVADKLAVLTGATNVLSLAAARK